MARERQQRKLQKTATELFLAAIKNNESSFLPKLPEYYFSYLLASWVLSRDERELLSTVFISKLAHDIDSFCMKHFVKFEHCQYEKITAMLLSEDHCLQADIFVRRLFLHYLTAHQHIVKRLLYSFPNEEHKKILDSNLKYLERSKFKIVESQQKLILSASEKIKSEFLKDIKIYGEIYEREKTFLQFSIQVLVYFIFQYIIAPFLDYIGLDAITRDNPRKDSSTFTFQLFVGV